MANKENMKQAMKELLGMVGVGEQAAEDHEAPETEEAQAQFVEKPDGKGSGEIGPVNFEEVQREVAEEMEKNTGKETEEKRFAGGFIRRHEEQDSEKLTSESASPADPVPVLGYEPKRSCDNTVLSEGTTLFGDIHTEGDIELRGKLKGNLEAAGNVCITGKVLGDVKGNSIELLNCAVQGNITATGRLHIDHGTVVVGDIAASDFVTDGKVKGCIHVTKGASFQSGAILVGDVSAALVSMSEGAKIEGVLHIDQEHNTAELFNENLEI